jgi:EAL domain-containing protein (putative c-di-GMP-specific phosphodiesterase class I)
VISKALAYGASLIRAKTVGRDFQLSINCGESFLGDDEAVSFLARQLSANGLTGKNLILEVSEQSSILRTAMVERVRGLGIGLAIDDVGLNQSNLDRLVDSGATIAKLDKRWLRGDDDRGQTGTVLSHLIPLCQDLGLIVVAEGVEVEAQLAGLRERGVSLFQGHMFGRPVPPEVFTAMLVDAADPKLGGAPTLEGSSA